MPKAVSILGSDHTVQFCLKGEGLNLLKISTFMPSYNRCWPKYLSLGIRNGKTTNATHSGPTTFLSSELCASLLLLLLLINNIVLQLSHNSHDPILPISAITFQNLMIKGTEYYPTGFSHCSFKSCPGKTGQAANVSCSVCHFVQSHWREGIFLGWSKFVSKFCLLQWSDAPKLTVVDCKRKLVLILCNCAISEISEKEVEKEDHNC